MSNDALDAAGLTILVKPATPLALGFDIDFPLSTAKAKGFKDTLGYTFCLRYLSHSGAQGAGDLSSAETVQILQAGLGLMAVQHPRLPGWTANGIVGTEDGTKAATFAAGASLPAGISVFCDLEGINTAVNAADVIAFCNNWFDAVNGAGYLPGVYVGFNSILNASQLSGLKFKSFWKSCSRVPIPSQGFSMTQAPCDVERGIPPVSVDENRVSASPSGLAWVIAS